MYEALASLETRGCTASIRYDGCAGVRIPPYKIKRCPDVKLISITNFGHK